MVVFAIFAVRINLAFGLWANVVRRRSDSTDTGAIGPAKLAWRLESGTSACF